MKFQIGLKKKSIHCTTNCIDEISHISGSVQVLRLTIKGTDTKIIPT